MMRSIAFSAAVALAALSAPALSQPGGGQSIRNDARSTLSCNITLHGTSRYQRVILRPGESWRPQSARRRASGIYCNPPGADIRYRLEANRAYRLVQDPESVRIILRAI